MEKHKGLIFNIQKYCVHDGPGIRSVIFFKGCPLACKWCSNPEGISHKQELSYKEKECIGEKECGYCSNVCEENAIFFLQGKAQIDLKKCVGCMKCADACPAQAIEQMGYWYTVEEVLSKILSDQAFYARSGGGITLSGGEPLLQPKFIIDLLKEAKIEGLSTAIETTGCVPWEIIKEVFPLLDTIHMDIKIIDSEKHKKFTGKDNKKILENFEKICLNFPEKEIVVRTPVIPGVNDSVDEIQKIADYINGVVKNNRNVSYELLPFHNFGSSKYLFQGKKYEFAEYKNMDKNYVKQLREKINSKIPIKEVK